MGLCRYIHSSERLCICGVLIYISTAQQIASHRCPRLVPMNEAQMVLNRYFLFDKLNLVLSPVFLMLRPFCFKRYYSASVYMSGVPIYIAVISDTHKHLRQVYTNKQTSSDIGQIFLPSNALVLFVSSLFDTTSLLFQEILFWACLHGRGISLHSTDTVNTRKCLQQVCTG